MTNSIPARIVCKLSQLIFSTSSGIWTSGTTWPTGSRAVLYRVLPEKFRTEFFLSKDKYFVYNFWRVEKYQWNNALGILLWMLVNILCNANRVPNALKVFEQLCKLGHHSLLLPSTIYVYLIKNRYLQGNTELLWV